MAEDVVDVVTERDWEGKLVAEFIGMETLEPKRGCVVGGPPFQVRSATVQHRQHGGVNGRGKGRGQGL
jgi:hypothetical protein